jgi:AAA+ lid domain
VWLPGERIGLAVVAATSRPNAVDAALRRPGRLDREVAIPLPGLEVRVCLSVFLCAPAARCCTEAWRRETGLAWLRRAATVFFRAAMRLQPSAFALKRGFVLEPFARAWNGSDAGVCAQEREQILRLHTAALPLAPDVDLGVVAGGCGGYSGADLAALCSEAAMRALAGGCRNTCGASLFRGGRERRE